MPEASIVARTARLRLRELDVNDAGAVLALVNEPGWLTHIGDRGVRTVEDAQRYLRDGPLAMYASHGFGLWAVERLADSAWLGMCGLLRRDSLPDVDLGYALFEVFQGHGYALEAAQASVELARTRFALARLLAIVSPGNAASIRLLGKLGMRHRERLWLAGGSDPVECYAIDPLAGDSAPDPG